MNKINNFLSALIDNFKRDGISKGKIQRDPRYVIILTFAVLTLILSTIQAYDLGTLDSIERPIFEFFNKLPAYLLPFFYVVTQLGSALSIFLWLAISYPLGKFRLAATTFISGFSAWIISKIMKTLIGRGRPGEVLDSITALSREVFNGNGFPSGHSAFVAACIFAIYYHVDRRYRKYLLLIVVLVGISRIYLGAHFPLDVVGGWALGACTASIVSLAIGTRRAKINYAELKKKLAHYNIAAKSIKQLNVDARGSVPLVATLENGKQLFVKVFGKQEHAADWIYKTFRFLKYKSTINEEAFISSKRNMEIEALGGLWAKNAGVRTPKTIVMFPLGNRWVLVQEMIDAKSLTGVKKISDKTLKEIWNQIKILHNANISHRDLRADNIIIDNKGNPYIIDFGFSQIAPSAARKKIDIAQLLVSLSLITSPERAVRTSLQALNEKELLDSVPYIQKATLSAAILDSIKSEDYLDTIVGEINSQSSKTTKKESVELHRINGKKLLGIVLFGVFLYIIVPQLNEFKGALGSLSTLQFWWILPLVAASFMTYVFAGAIVYTLVQKPIKFYRTVLVQFASSFVSKIVPGGVGSASLNIRYLKSAGLTTGESSGIIFAERIIGFFGLMTLIILFGASKLKLGSVISIDIELKQIIFVAATLAVLAIIFKINNSWREKLKSVLKDIKDQIIILAKSPKKLFLAYLWATLVTIAYTACLYFSLRAVGVSLGLLEILVVYLGSIAAKGLSPTPGGLGALEAAMAVALQSFGLDIQSSFATVVVYRIATYWLPLPFGILAYNYISAKDFV